MRGWSARKLRFYPRAWSTTGCSRPEVGRTRSIVGALGPSSRLRRPQFDSANSTLFEQGPIAVAATGPRPDWSDVICLVDGFLSERDELAEALGLPASRSDEELAGEAYLRWGEEMPARLRGEFTVFAWRPAAERGVHRPRKIGGPTDVPLRSGLDLLLRLGDQ